MNISANHFIFEHDVSTTTPSMLCAVAGRPSGVTGGEEASAARPRMPAVPGAPLVGGPLPSATVAWTGGEDKTIRQGQGKSREGEWEEKRRGDKDVDEGISSEQGILGS